MEQLWLSKQKSLDGIPLDPEKRSRTPSACVGEAGSQN